MREILFRGKRIDNGAWVEGDLLHSYFKKGDTCICCPNWTNIKQITPETVGQFTGLTDKNGVRIFEGDVATCKEFECIGKIEYEEDSACYLFCPLLEDGGFDCESLCDYAGELEIIGNIHDNPELLKGES